MYLPPPRPTYPTEHHLDIVQKITALLVEDVDVWACAVAGSLAWGGADERSDVDLVAFVEPEMLDYYRSPAWRRRLERLGGYHDPINGLRFDGIRVDVEFTTGAIAPQVGLPRLDDYELVIGRYVRYSVPLFEREGRYQTWARQFLPYFPEAWRQERMQLVWRDLHFNINYLRQMADRALLFHGFERVVYGARYLVHYLFLQERRHAIDWLKHLEWQAREVLERPELIDDVRALITLPELSAGMLSAKAAQLEGLVAKYLHLPG